MKSNVLKSSLGAFAFFLAIVASFSSFAFSPSSDDVIEEGYIDIAATNDCYSIGNIECQINFSFEVCTIIIDGCNITVYNTSCTTVLYAID